MSNVHGFGNLPQNRPNMNNPPQRNNNPRPNDQGNGGFLEAINEPVIEDQLRIAQ